MRDEENTFVGEPLADVGHTDKKRKKAKRNASSFLVPEPVTPRRLPKSKWTSDVHDATCSPPQGRRYRVGINPARLGRDGITVIASRHQSHYSNECSLLVALTTVHGANSTGTPRE